MPVRRLTRIRVVITGVENAGRSTLTEHLADALDWPRVAEAARHDDTAVIGHTEHPPTSSACSTLHGALDGRGSDTLFDTGPVVLDLWSRPCGTTPSTGVDAVMDRGRPVPALRHPARLGA